MFFFDRVSTTQPDGRRKNSTPGSKNTLRK
jgi:hypothetical protein